MNGALPMNKHLTTTKALLKDMTEVANNFDFKPADEIGLCSI